MTPPCTRPHLQLSQRDGTWVLACTACGLVMVEFGVPNRWRALRPGTRFCLALILISVLAVVGIVVAVISGWST